jgi:hypothetical protein
VKHNPSYPDALVAGFTRELLTPDALKRLPDWCPVHDLPAIQVRPTLCRECLRERGIDGAHIPAQRAAWWKRVAPKERPLD